MVTPSPPRFEHHRVALGIGESTPRLSWKTVAEAGWRQSAYQLELTRGNTMWMGARTHSGDSVLVPWPSDPLQSRERVSVRVRVFGATPDGATTTSDWSEPGVVEAGLLSPSDWIAAPVGGAWAEDPDTDDRRPALVRRDFTARGPVVAARLYAARTASTRPSSTGVASATTSLSPGWTVYRERLRYYTYDVTDLVIEGENALGAWLGDGWYRGRLGWRRRLPQPLRRRPLVHRAARADLRRRHPARPSRPTRAGAPPPARSCHGHLRRRDVRRPRRACGLVVAAGAAGLG